MPGAALLFFLFRFEYLISGPKSYRDFRETGPWDGNVSVFELETGKNLLEIKPQSWRINGKKTESQLYFSERTGKSC